MKERTFVAREEQLQQLEDKLALALDEQGQIGFVSGEAADLGGEELMNLLMNAFFPLRKKARD